MDRDVFLSLLALDAYNRGYGPNIDDLPFEAQVTRIGNATIVTDSAIEIGGTAQAAGFYAIAYDWNGERVISYRGTNFETGSDLLAIFNSPAVKDIWGGWRLGAGYADASQAGLAEAGRVH